MKMEIHLISSAVGELNGSSKSRRSVVKRRDVELSSTCGIVSYDTLDTIILVVFQL